MSKTGWHRIGATRDIFRAPILYHRTIILCIFLQYVSTYHHSSRLSKSKRLFVVFVLHFTTALDDSHALESDACQYHHDVVQGTAGVLEGNCPVLCTHPFDTDLYRQVDSLVNLFDHKVEL